MNYAELFCQSHFSFLHGASSPEELVQQAAALGYDALALTDECSVAGIVRAYRQIKDQALNIKLIVGSYFQLDKLELVLLCPDKAAYAELCRIITNARRRSSKGEYCLTEWDLMSLKHCLLLWLPAGDSESDSYWANWLQKYHSDRLWLAMRRQLSHNEAAFTTYCQQLAQQYQLNAVCCGAVLMHVPQRLALQHCVSAIKAGKPIAELGRQLLSNAERALRPLAKLEKLFSAALLQQSCVIAARCTFSLDELKYQYPSELVPAGETAAGYLARLVVQGSKLRFPAGVPKRVQAIIDKEMALITELNYEYFFLTIYDLVQFAKSKAILYQGRGSAANSVVCYCLEITAVDPDKIQVLFERFLSRERKEPPDIDVDFELDSRLFNTNVLDNTSKQDYINFKIDYSQPLKLLDEGKISLGTLIDELSFETQNFGITNLDYTRRTVAGYLEFQTKYKKFDFILGTRAEDYNITGNTDTDELIPFKQFRFFPNATLQYNFAPQIFFNVN